ncbi:MAG: cytochrome c peroxidase [Geothrix sp.]|uniref:cytochrome-c peroxidase n=1 Tax=Geothrix sp. TaxID=1962974 RepID=UPI003BAF1B72
MGAQLFFDSRLSLDGTRSCASCHDPTKAWANHDRTDTGVLGRVGARNSGTVLDAARMEYQFWDGRAASLEAQAWGPILNPLEMGETVAGVLAKLKAIPEYRAQFRAVFRSGVTQAGVAQALAAFERTLMSGPSPYDRFQRGERRALSEAARRGLDLFEGKARCFRCHNGPALSNQGFANLGVGMGRPNPDPGREAVTGDPEDRGRFKTPGLRNVALTWPYFHDGSAASLEEVIDFYDRGGEPNGNLDPRIRPLGLTPGEKRDLKAFLEALTGMTPVVRVPALPRQGPATS